jgi:DNA polymerase-1
MTLAMMRSGMLIDLDHFDKMDKTLTCDMDKVTEDVHRTTGYYINLDSGDQVSDLLFKKLGLKQARPSLTKSGDRESVEEEVLLAIQHDHPCIPLILEYKEFSKLRGTYVRPMPKLAKRTAFGEWKLFPRLGSTRVPSGRFNSYDPNLLAIPTRTERGREIRDGFPAPSGWVYCSVDESQIEVREAAHDSGDPGLIKIYENEEDIYSDFATAAFKLEDKRYFDKEAKKWKYPTVDKNEHRFPAKTCVLASIYDVSAKGLLEQMPIICANCKKESTKHDCHKFESYWTENKCQDLLNAFYLKYPGVLTDRKKNHRRAMNKAYVWCMWGRLLHVQAVRSVHEWVVSAALREAGNFPYQSGAGGTFKLTMGAFNEDIENGLEEVVVPHLPIHDELVFTAREDIADEAIELLKYRFETCVRLRVPIKAGGAKAATWGQLEK